MSNRPFFAMVIVSLLLGSLAGIAWVEPARAQGPVCYVDDTAVGPAHDGLTWATAFQDLQLAINFGNGSEIHVAAGTYRPTGGADRNATFQLHNSMTIIGGYPDGGGDVSQPAVNETILSGDIGTPGVSTDNSYHVVTGSGNNSTAVLDGFTIRDGNASAVSFGAALYIDAGSPHVKNTLITANVATAGGGAYFLNASPSLSGVTFDGNTAWQGGGLYISGGAPELTDVTFRGNRGNSEGGGLYIESGSPSLTNATFRGNVAGTNGGGVYAANSVARYTNLLLAGNSAAQGAGMSNQTDSDPQIVNATIAGNTASVGGGAMELVNSSPTLANVIVWGNTGLDFIVSVTDGSPSAVLNNGILEEACPFVCTATIDSDPLFVDAAAGDYRIAADSPAVDAGNLAVLPSDYGDMDGDGDLVEPLSQDLNGDSRVVIDRLDLGAYEAQVWNTNWTQSARLSLAATQPDVYSRSVDRYLERQGQSRWFKFTIQPSSKVLVTLTGLPANYDLALYRDISQAYQALGSSQDLVHLSAEFAPDTFSPDTFSPDTFSPDTFSPDTFSPDTFSPDTFSPDTFSPDTFSPDTFSPDTFSPDTFSPDTFSPDTFSPDTFSPDTFSPDTFSPDTFSPDTFSPDMFSSAQTRSLIAVSSHEGTLGEGIIANTWTQSGDFYVRVRGRNGAFDPAAPFRLQVTLLSGACGPVTPVLPASNTEVPAGGYQTLIVTNLAKTAGTAAEKTRLHANLAALAARTHGWVVDVGSDSRVSAAAVQAETYSSCVYAMNLQAGTVKEIVDRFRELNPGLEYIVLAGNDRAIPFFRYADTALLASEVDYSPPVLDDTTSQASLKSGYILSQDAYGAAAVVSYKAGALPVPDLAVGRLVETASDINHVLDAYLQTPDGIVAPANALVTGYDFLEDAANAVLGELQSSLGAGAVDTLIMDSALSPQDPSAWTADDLRASLLGHSHGIAFLAGHFSAYGALAADYKTRLTAGEVLSSTTSFTNSLVYSAGCHSGYNVVNEHGIPNVTEEPDWAQAFAAKGATFIGGTGYQYGDTEFIEYSERLYVEFTRQLRYGDEPVAVGQALVKAKQAYLANTPLMRGIHEKSMLEATLFGLPMLRFDLPARLPAPADASIVSSTSAFTTNPGQALGLHFVDISVASPLTEQSITLTVLSPAGGAPTQEQAVYLQGPDGVVVNPAEPVLPLDMLNVTSPLPDYVLRGVGWRGGAFTDLLDRLPLTGAATDDLRAAHPAFFSDAFYPVRPWNVNYFDALDSAGGPTRLAWMPAQYRSESPGSLTGVLRRWDRMDFRLYYSANIGAYPSSDPSWVNRPALAAPPDIPRIVSTFSAEADTVGFEITATGDPSAGIQEVWIVYAFENGAPGAWLPLDLTQDATDTRLWHGALALGGNAAADLRFVVQAVNGVGLVTLMTNEGAYYLVAVDAAVLPAGLPPVTLTLDRPAAGGPYGGQQEFTAVATQDGSPIAGLPITFYLGEQGRLAVTGGDGAATAKFFLLAQPGSYTLSAAFAGSDSHAPADAHTSFEIGQGVSAVVLEPAAQQVAFGSGAQVTATVSSGGLPLAGKSVALTADANGATRYASVTVTDYAGHARWEVPALPGGSYTLKAWFGLPVSEPLDLSSAFYVGSSETASLIVETSDTTTSLSLAPRLLVSGRAMILTARVAPVAPAVGVPSGQVQFQIDGAKFGGPVDLVNGVATRTAISTLTAGAHTFRARYLGAADFAASTDELVQQVSAHMTLKMTVDRGTAPAGWVMHFTIKVTNDSGATLPSITITDTLPWGTLFVSAGEGGVHSGRRVVWRLTNVPVGGTRTLHLNVGTYSTFRQVIDNLATAESSGFTVSARASVRVVAP